MNRKKEAMSVRFFDRPVFFIPVLDRTLEFSFLSFAKYQIHLSHLKFQKCIIAYSFRAQKADLIENRSSIFQIVSHNFSLTQNISGKDTSTF